MSWNVVRAGFLLTVFKNVEVLDVMIQVVKPSCLLCLCRCRQYCDDQHHCNHDLLHISLSSLCDTPYTSAASQFPSSRAGAGLFCRGAARSRKYICKGTHVYFIIRIFELIIRIVYEKRGTPCLRLPVIPLSRHIESFRSYRHPCSTSGILTPV